MQEEQVQKVISTFIEIEVKSDDDFLILRETLRRMGIANKAKKTIYQSANVLHKRGKYYLCHFKQMMELDGRKSTFDDIDRGRLNKICRMLEDWGLTKVLCIPAEIALAEPQYVFILSSQQAREWTLEEKYKIGVKKW